MSGTNFHIAHPVVPYSVGVSGLESIIIVLTLYKLLRHTARCEDVGDSSTPRVIVRDSLVYFIIMFAMLVANVILYRDKSPYSSLLLGPCSTVACITVSRMMINLREIRRREEKTAGRRDALPDRRWKSKEHWSRRMLAVLRQNVDV
ncbi:hypothetical protein PLICRDRAFT_540454 [Plicaturopsis crispa FD-325 SS-3]|nr:hypothetical protein PLICRDRAFT_540454 [Plicaturopsis crispa FD-325 SS-3]